VLKNSVEEGVAPEDVITDAAARGHEAAPSNVPPERPESYY
jgi:hypothetical protein